MVSHEASVPAVTPVDESDIGSKTWINSRLRNSDPKRQCQLKGEDGLN